MQLRYWIYHRVSGLLNAGAKSLYTFSSILCDMSRKKSNGSCSLELSISLLIAAVLVCLSDSF